MTGEEGKGDGGGTGGAKIQNDNANVVQQNGNLEKAPVVAGTNVETLPRAGKQVGLSI